jgi:hypothetical protein
VANRVVEGYVLGLSYFAAFATAVAGWPERAKAAWICMQA